MNIVVVGGGAVGTWLATELARAGEDVTLIVPAGAAPEAGALRLSVEDHDGGETRWAIVPVSDASAGPVDLAILAVKTPDLAAAARHLAGTGGARYALTLGPSERAEALARAELGATTICAAALGCRLESERRGSALLWRRGPLWLAAPAEVAAALGRAVAVTPVAAVAPTRHSLQALAAPRALAALTNRPFADVLADPHLGDYAARLLREALQILLAAGASLDDLPEIAANDLRQLPGIAGLFQARYLRRHPALLAAPPGPDALAQSLARHRASEIDDLAGWLVERAATSHTPAPLNERVVALVHEVERTGKFLAPEELARALARR